MSAGSEDARRVEVLGVGVDATSLTEATDRIVRRVDDGEGGYVCVRDVHGIVLCQDDPELREIHGDAFMVTTDGIPLVRAVRAAGHRGATRVYGPDLMLEVCARRIGRLRHLLYGSSPETVAALRQNLERRFPGILIVGAQSPPFRALDDEELAHEHQLLRSLAPDVIWVGLSTPKQERWMARSRAALAPAVLVGVGAAFDLHAGRKPQAPAWMQRSGLEWLFRMLAEPRRLGPRYLVVIPRYLVLRGRERSMAMIRRRHRTRRP
jgi:N-acetylglucosaminyldiphosphoundecaprenol N-acetyl-beta-D-mannosaminyltransferase